MNNHNNQKNKYFLLSLSLSLSIAKNIFILSITIILLYKMEFQKIINLLDKEIRFKTSMRRLDLCGFSDEYIIETGDITVSKTNIYC